MLTLADNAPQGPGSFGFPVVFTGCRKQAERAKIHIVLINNLDAIGANAFGFIASQRNRMIGLPGSHWHRGIKNFFGGSTGKNSRYFYLNARGKAPGMVEPLNIRKFDRTNHNRFRKSYFHPMGFFIRSWRQQKIVFYFTGQELFPWEGSIAFYGLRF